MDVKTEKDILSKEIANLFLVLFLGYAKNFYSRLLSSRTKKGPDLLQKMVDILDRETFTPQPDRNPNG